MSRVIETQPFVVDQNPQIEIDDAGLEGAKAPRTWSKVLEAVLVGAIVFVGIYIHAKNAQQFPVIFNDDEGTYVAQAWAVLTGLGAHHGPAPYTYWYDHPPLGWIQIAIWAFFANTFHSGALLAIGSARTFMSLLFVIDLLLFYAITRTAGLRPITGIVALATFSFSPLSVQLLRMVYLDTVAIPWLLLTILILLGKRRTLLRSLTAGATFGVCVLTKETFLLFLPALIMILFQSVQRPMRKFAIVGFLGASAVIGSFYILFATLRGELFPGPQHVSLIGSIEYQLFQRSADGSIFNLASQKTALAISWFHLDPYLISSLLLTIPFTLLAKRSRYLGVALIIGLLGIVRPGYVPVPFIFGYIPLMALAIGYSLDNVYCQVEKTLLSTLERPLFSSSYPRRIVHQLAHSRANLLSGNRQTSKNLEPHKNFLRAPAKTTIANRISLLLISLVVVVIGIKVTPMWSHSDVRMDTVKTTNTQVAVETWIIHHAPKSSVILVDDNYWVDLVDNGFAPSHVIWEWKYGPDPAVLDALPQRWADFNYVILSPIMRVSLSLNQLNQVNAVISHSRPVISFGTGAKKTIILKVIHPPA